MSGIKEIIKKGLVVSDDITDKLIVQHLRNGEFRKYKSPKRKAIYETIILTDEQKKEIDQLYKTYYGEKIPYTWHRHFTAFTGKFDKNYIPELLFIPEFEHFMNYNSSYVEAFADKNVTPMIAKMGGVLSPNVFLSCTEGIATDGSNIFAEAEVNEFLRDIGEAFIKPSVDTGSGKGCMVIDVHGGIDSISGKTVKELLSQFGRNYVIQERLICHPSIRKIYPNSVNTFRVITYRWKDSINVMPVIMRIGQGESTVDNAHAGGLFIAIDDDGVLHRTAFTEFKDTFTVHPDTNLAFEGYKIENFDKVLIAAKKLHSLVPQIGVYHWDFTINTNGIPVLIEANTECGGIWVAQMAHGCGVFGDLTPEILLWTGKMKRMSKSKRQEFAFGNL